MPKNVTVSSSGLSALQKRILAYARQRMRDQRLTITPAENSVDICLAAPEWLAKAVVDSVAELLGDRKRHFSTGDNGEAQIHHEHPILQFFLEVSRVESAIRDAAEQQGKSRSTIHLTELYEDAGGERQIIVLGLGAMSIPYWYHPWPYYEDGRLFFRVTVECSEAELLEKMPSHNFNEDAWLKPAQPTYPIACTMPEMLRDLYGFPVRDGGHVDALAFDPDAIGRQKYNTANAALRRACDRLWRRGLIRMRHRGMGRWWTSGIYERTGIALTEAGIAVADSR